MKTIHFSSVINAAPKDVWEAMLGLETFKDWTSAFMQGSYFEGSWELGEKIRFLAPGGSGMVAIIAERREYEFISIKHIGFIGEGVEDTESDAVRQWAPAFENYTFVDLDGATEVRVDQDVTGDFEEFMLTAWPKALARLKTICEAR